MYVCSFKVVLILCELKSQYGHFWIHQGIWIYKDNGGRVVNECVANMEIHMMQPYVKSSKIKILSS